MAEALSDVLICVLNGDWTVHEIGAIHYETAKQTQSVSFVICSYDNDETIVDIVRACRAYSDESEVIVVDGGSSDTNKLLVKELALEFGIRYEQVPTEAGKNVAIAHGVMVAGGDIILFLDGDLRNLKNEHIDAMLRPMKKGADMVVSRTGNTRIRWYTNLFGLDTCGR